MEDDVDAGDKQADAMASLERRARAPLGFVAASSGSEGGNAKSIQSAPVVAANPEALDIDADDE